MAQSMTLMITTTMIMAMITSRWSLAESLMLSREYPAVVVLVFPDGKTIAKWKEQGQAIENLNGKVHL